MRDVLSGAAAAVAVVALVSVVATSCGAAQEPDVQVEAARVAACEAAERAIEDSLTAGAIDRQVALLRIDAVRSVCDELHLSITKGAP